MALSKEPTRDERVWWYDVDRGQVVYGRVKSVDKDTYIHFLKEDGALLPPAPQAMRDCHGDRVAALEAGLRFLEVARFNLESKIRELQRQKEGPECLEQHKWVVNPMDLRLAHAEAVG